MKLKILLFAVMSFPFLWSCDKEEIPVFASNDAGIYFQRLTSTVYGSTTEYYSDSTDFSFAGMYAYYTSHVLNAPVLTMGKVVDYDRPFKVVVDMEESTAIEGIDFEIELDSLVIKAGTSNAVVPVRLLRTETLLEKSLKIVLRLQENEHFKCYLKPIKTRIFTRQRENKSVVFVMFSRLMKCTRSPIFGKIMRNKIILENGHPKSIRW